MSPLRALLAVHVLRAVVLAEILTPVWHRYYYYPGNHAHGIRYFQKLAAMRENFQKGIPHNKWGFYNRVDVASTASDKKPPRRLRMGSGWWKLVPPMGAEINCEFPGTVPVMSNIVWERVDPGKEEKESVMRRTGDVQTYDMHLRSKGSTLHFHEVTPLDRGLYRCLASSVDRLTGELQTIFQDTGFYPDIA